MTAAKDGTAMLPVPFPPPFPTGPVSVPDKNSGLVTPPADDDADDGASRNGCRGEAQGIVGKVVDLYHRLLVHGTLTPRPEVSETFGRLVRACTEPHGEEVVETVLADSMVGKLAPSLIRLCSAGETELELSWARRIVHSVSAATTAHEQEQLARHTLEQFPYHTNYNRLTALESANLSTLLPAPPTAIAFLGCGPLPLSALCLADRFPAVRITNVDREAVAVRLATEVAGVLGYGDRVYFRCADAGERGALDTFDVVFVAALVGMEEREKVALVRTIAGGMREGAILCVRSAHSLRRLLYPSLEMMRCCEGMGLRPLLEVHPWHDVVNSTLFMRVERDGASSDEDDASRGS